MYVGADFYPEHWKKSEWKRYAQLMRKARFNIVRMAEFAWTLMEPEEGVFTFDWLDEAIAMLHKHGVSTILGTPTGAMPSWVPRKYPEAMSMQPNGERTVHGVRKNNCFSSVAFRSLSRGITRAMAEHYKKTPGVVGWQTDNEFDGQICCCPACQAEFQDWLKRNYKTLDALNAAWGAHFWGHTYRAWNEIPINVDMSRYNPSLCLDIKRFVSWLNVRFQHDQVDIIRTACPGHFITHNLMGLYPELDYWDLSQDLDFVSWDNYTIAGGPKVNYWSSMAGDLMRSMKKKNYWIMEMTSGPCGWSHLGRNPRPGEMRSIVFQQLAHGADGFLWFRWRACTAGREQYWHGIIGHDNKPGRRYRETAQIASQLHTLDKELKGTTVKPRVAMVWEYDNLWAIDIQYGHKENKLRAAAERWYEALMRAGIACDFVTTNDDFSGYKLIIAPQLFIMRDALAHKLSAFAKNGGVLVTDTRTGVKNQNNLCIERVLPGLLTDALGIAIEEYEGLSDWEGKENITYSLNGEKDVHGEFTAWQFCDWVSVKTAERLAGYGEWHLKNFAAVTKNSFGKGFAYYVGTVVKEPRFYDQIAGLALASAKIKPVARPPEGVETVVREGAGKKTLFIINHTEQRQIVTVPAGKKELLTNKTTQQKLSLDRYGVAVIRL